MPSNKDILEAQRFNRRRLVTAFTSGTPGGKELESKSTTRPLIVGASIATVVVLIAVAIGRFLPTLPSGWENSHLIITKGEGAGRPLVGMKLGGCRDIVGDVAQSDCAPARNTFK